ncbi:M23 family metallopeptidase [Candidatus Peregrinibacteria bacterium]|nr:MAG: M23 family metallopeptidase [Candidatus Peregrinibacteria bacterium]
MSKVDAEVQKERHRKLFEGQYHSWLGRVWFYTKRSLKKIWNVLTPSAKVWSEFTHPLDQWPAPKRLYTQLASWSIGLLVLTSINVSNAAFGGGEGVGQEYLSLDATAVHMTDDEGYIIKAMPLEGEATFDMNRAELVEHEVQEGETLSMIAYRYGISISSIRYANTTLGSSDYLKIGQTLKIPPKDGIYITVPSGATLVSLMDKYKGNLDDTKTFNSIESDDDLNSGDQLFIVGGKPEVVYVAAINSGARSTAGGYSATGPSVSAYEIPANDLGWIRPTIGIITQGFKGGHPAYDIADRSKPDILAVMAGTVVDTGEGWSGGYGNHVWIDHGNGYKTHYAHMTEFYVQVGDTVTLGQVIGKMGNTGRVYGATGIHLHFEISYNGTKINPSFMGVW